MAGHRRNSRLTLTVICLTTSLVCGVSAFTIFGQHIWHGRGRAATPDAIRIVTTEIPNPGEAAPGPQASAGYAVAATQPRRISLPSVAAEGLIQKVGLTSAKAMAAPSNVHFAGWFTDSVPPGEPGLSIIDGHVSGKYEAGVFKRLKDLAAGDGFDVEFGDMTRRHFVVVSVRQVPEAQAVAILFDKHPDISRQLNLITCGGRFDRGSQQYADRIIVVSRQAPAD